MIYLIIRIFLEEERYNETPWSISSLFSSNQDAEASSSEAATSHEVYIRLRQT